MAAIKVLHSTSSSFINLHLSIILGHAKPLFNALTSGLKPHTQLPACLTRRHDTATVHSATMASPHPPSMHITVSRTRPSAQSVPRDVLARDAAILIRACASNERRSVDARVGLRICVVFLVPGKSEMVAQAHNRRRRTGTSACRRQ